tara:strand:- start:6234 stop:6680 length:447 start_codon:yes stop_codon:yes gene_type:complete
MAVADYALAGGSGALGGAGTGAAIGSAIGGPLGTGIGAGVGALIGGGLGLLGQSQADKQAEEQKRLVQKQTRRAKNLAAKQRSVERRSIAQNKEASARALKEGRDIQPPTIGGQQFALIQSMAVGSGSPFDSFIQRTYGRPQTSDPTV